MLRNLSFKKDKFMKSKAIKIGSSILAGILAPSLAHACACGCGIFDVATASMFPEGPGGMAFLDFDYQNQYKNWSGLNRAPSANNGDKSIATFWVTPGFEYFYNRSWGWELEVPYENRAFKTVTSNPNVPMGTLASQHWSDIGDIRARGIYTGFSEDMSTGLTFGLKLPTGNYTYNNAWGDVDRDSEIGTGSTDLLVGMFHRGHLTKDGSFDWFGQVETDLPMLTRDEYRPGFEADEAVGIYYNGFSVGKVNIVPIAQMLASERTSDSGNYASGGIDDPPVGQKDSGYQRVLLSPGIEFDMHPFSLYADVEVPVIAHVVGNQLVAPALFKVIFTYHF
jgi:hypothetical protein